MPRDDLELFLRRQDQITRDLDRQEATYREQYGGRSPSRPSASDPGPGAVDAYRQAVETSASAAARQPAFVGSRNLAPAPAGPDARTMRDLESQAQAHQAWQDYGRHQLAYRQRSEAETVRKHLEAERENLFREEGVDFFSSPGLGIQPRRDPQGRLRFKPEKGVRRGTSADGLRFWALDRDEAGNLVERDETTYVFDPERPQQVFRHREGEDSRDKWIPSGGLREALAAEDNPRLQEAARAQMAVVDKDIADQATRALAFDRLQTREQMDSRRQAVTDEVAEALQEYSTLREQVPGVRKRADSGFLGFGGDKEAAAELSRIQNRIADIESRLPDVLSVDPQDPKAAERLAAKALELDEDYRAARERYSGLSDEDNLWRAYLDKHDGDTGLAIEDFERSYLEPRDIDARDSELVQTVRRLRAEVGFPSERQAREQQEAIAKLEKDPVFADLGKRARELEDRQRQLEEEGLPEGADPEEVQAQMSEEFERLGADIQTRAQIENERRQQQHEARGRLIADSLSKFVAAENAMRFEQQLEEHDTGTLSRYVATGPPERGLPAKLTGVAGLEKALHTAVIGGTKVVAKGVGGLAGLELTDTDLLVEREKRAKELADKQGLKLADAREAATRAMRDEYLAEFDGDAEEMERYRQHFAWNDIEKEQGAKISQLTGEILFHDRLLAKPEKFEEFLEFARNDTGWTDADVEELGDTTVERLRQAYSEYREAVKLDQIAVADRHDSGWRKFKADYRRDAPGSTDLEVYNAYVEDLGVGDVLWGNVVGAWGGAAGLFKAVLAGAGASLSDVSGMGDEQIAKFVAGLVDDAPMSGDVRVTGLVGQTVGQVVPMILASAAVGRLKLSKTRLGHMSAVIGQGLVWGLAEGAGNYKQVYDANVKSAGEEAAHEMGMEALHKSIPAGFLEMLPIDRIFRKIPRSKARHLLQVMAGQMGAETAQELFQQEVSNIINQQASDRALTDQHLSLGELAEIFTGIGLVTAPIAIGRRRKLGKQVAEGAAALTTAQAVEAKQAIDRHMPAVVEYARRPVSQAAQDLGADNPESPAVQAVVRAGQRLAELEKQAKVMRRVSQYEQLADSAVARGKVKRAAAYLKKARVTARGLGGDTATLEDSIALQHRIAAHRQAMAEGLPILAARIDRSRQIQALSDEIEALTPQAVADSLGLESAADIEAPTFTHFQQVARGLAKVALGDSGSLTQAEEQALAVDAAGEEHAPRWYDHEGEPVITDDAAATLKQLIPQFGRLLPLTETQRKRAIVEKQQQAEREQAQREQEQQEQAPESPESGTESPESGTQSPESGTQSPESGTQSPGSAPKVELNEAQKQAQTDLLQFANNNPEMQQRIPSERRQELVEQFVQERAEALASYERERDYDLARADFDEFADRVAEEEIAGTRPTPREVPEPKAKAKPKPKAKPVDAAAAKKRVMDLMSMEDRRTLEHIGVTVVINPEDPQARAPGIYYQDGEIRVHPEMFEDFRRRHGDEWARRAVDEEVEHAISEHAGRETYGDAWERVVSDLTAPGDAAERRLITDLGAGYSGWDKLSDYQRGMEILRMYRQAGRGALTEQAFANIPDENRRAQAQAAAKLVRAGYRQSGVRGILTKIRDWLLTEAHKTRKRDIALGMRLHGLSSKIDLVLKTAAANNPTERPVIAWTYRADSGWDSLDIGIENMAGTVREGPGWTRQMLYHYGHIRGTGGEGADGMAVDAYVNSDGLSDGFVYVVDQMTRDGQFDEHKVMIGFRNQAAAEAAYLAHYPEGWDRLGAISGKQAGDFVEWLEGGDLKAPFSSKLRKSLAPAAATGTEPEAEAEPETKAKRRGPVAAIPRAGDIIDAIMDFGGILSKTKARLRPGYREADYEGQPKLKGVYTQLMTGTEMPDQVLQSLVGQYGLDKGSKVDDLWVAITGALQSRDSVKEQSREEMLEDLEKKFSDARLTRSRLGKKKVSVPMAQAVPGDRFTLLEQEYEVVSTGYDEDTGLAGVVVGEVGAAGRVIKDGVRHVIDPEQVFYAEAWAPADISEAERRAQQIEMPASDAPEWAADDTVLFRADMDDLNRIVAEEEAAAPADEDVREGGGRSVYPRPPHILDVGDKRTDRDIQKERETTDSPFFRGRELRAGVPPVRFEAGRRLTREERDEVLESVQDAYQVVGLEKVVKGVDSRGEEIIGYPYTPEVFVTSDITGKPIRFWITLPDGRAAHPSELFPNLDNVTVLQHVQSKMAAAARQERDREHRRAEAVKRLDRWEEKTAEFEQMLEAAGRKGDSPRVVANDVYTELVPRQGLDNTILVTMGRRMLRLYNNPEARNEAKNRGYQLVEYIRGLDILTGEEAVEESGWNEEAPAPTFPPKSDFTLDTQTDEQIQAEKDRADRDKKLEELRKSKEQKRKARDLDTTADMFGDSDIPLFTGDHLVIDHRKKSPPALRKAPDTEVAPLLAQVGPEATPKDLAKVAQAYGMKPKELIEAQQEQEGGARQLIKDRFPPDSPQHVVAAGSIERQGTLFDMPPATKKQSRAKKAKDQDPRQQELFASAGPPASAEPTAGQVQEEVRELKAASEEYKAAMHGRTPGTGSDRTGRHVREEVDKAATAVQKAGFRLLRHLYQATRVGDDYFVDMGSREYRDISGWSNQRLSQFVEIARSGDPDIRHVFSKIFDATGREITRREVTGEDVRPGDVKLFSQLSDLRYLPATGATGEIRAMYLNTGKGPYGIRPPIEGDIFQHKGRDYVVRKITPVTSAVLDRMSLETKAKLTKAFGTSGWVDEFPAVYPSPNAIALISPAKPDDYFWPADTPTRRPSSPLFAAPGSSYPKLKGKAAAPYEANVLAKYLKATNTPGETLESRKAAIAAAAKELNESLQKEGRVSRIIHRLAPEATTSWDVRGYQIVGPKDFAILNAELRNPYTESLRIAVLDKNDVIVHSQVLHIGTLSESLASPQAFIRALHYANGGSNAPLKYKKVLIAHNHPSGDPLPSRADRELTRQINVILNNIDVTLVDHVITNGQEYFSFREMGLIGGGKARTGQRASRRKARPVTGDLYEPAWSAYPRDKLSPLDEPDLVHEAIRPLRALNPDADYAVYVDTKYKLMAVEQLVPRDGKKGHYATTVARSMAAEGAAAVFLSLGETSVSGTAIYFHVKNLIELMPEVRILDVLVKGDKGEPYKSLAEHGILGIAESPGDYGRRPATTPTVEGMALNMRQFTSQELRSAIAGYAPGYYRERARLIERMTRPMLEAEFRAVAPRSPGRELAAAAGFNARYFAKARRKGRTFMDAQGAERFEIDDSRAKIRQDKLYAPDVYPRRPAAPGEARSYYGDLGEILDHPELFRNYPALRTVMIDMDIDRAQLGEQGSFRAGTPGDAQYFPTDPEIRVVARHVEGAFATLIHEVQHAIQSFEKLTGGSNSRLIAADMVTDLEMVENEIAALEKHLKNDPESAEVRELLREALERRSRKPKIEEIAAIAHREYMFNIGETEARTAENRAGGATRTANNFERARDAARRLHQIFDSPRGRLDRARITAPEWSDVAQKSKLGTFARARELRNEIRRLGFNPLDRRVMEGLRSGDRELAGAPTFMADFEQERAPYDPSRAGEVTGWPEKGQTLSAADPDAQLPTIFGGDEEATIEAARSRPGYWSRLAQDFRDWEFFPARRNRASDDDIMEITIEFARANLLRLWDEMPPATRRRARLWYVGANRLAHEMARDYGLPTPAVAAVIAAYSPQRDWFTNMTLAERTLDLWHYGQGRRWDAKMTEVAERRGWDKEDWTALAGVKLKNIDSRRGKAVFIRAFDEAHNDKGMSLVTPEGYFSGEPVPVTGQSGMVRWGAFREIENVVSVLENPYDQQVRSKALGEGHKVRSFYNNIIAPDSGDHVTIDTHALTAAFLIPWGSGHKRVVALFKGRKGMKKGSMLRGVYPVVAEAYRRAAADRGVLPREMQSVAWEEIRSIFTVGRKADERNLAFAASAWQDYSKGRTTDEQAFNAIRSHLGKRVTPRWTRTGAKDTPRRRVSYQGPLAGRRLRGKGPGKGAPGGRGTGGSGRRVGQGGRVAQEPRPGSPGQRLGAAVSPATEAEYATAVADGDIGKQWSLVDQAAKRAGYTIGPVYHVTDQEFDVFDKGPRGMMYFNESPSGARAAALVQGGTARPFYLRAQEPLNTPETAIYHGDVEAARTGKVPESQSHIIAAAESFLDDGQEPTLLKLLRVYPEEDPADIRASIAVAKGQPVPRRRVETIFEVRGGDLVYVSDEGGVSIAVRNPEQIKSAEPVVRDDDGNVIPLSERFNPESPSILRAAVSPATEAEYARAVADGDMVTAQRLVDQAARAAGYDFAASHGTNRKDVTVFDPLKAGSNMTSDWSQTGTYWLPGHDTANYYASEAARRNDPVLQRLFREEEEAAAAMGTSPMMKSIDRQKIGQENYDRLRELENKWRQRIKELDSGEAGKGRVYNAYLKIRNPMVYQYQGITDPFLGDLAQGRGHDALVIVNEPVARDWRDQADEIITFSPNQIKSAEPVVRDKRGNVIPLSERFNPESPSILRAAAAPGEAVPNTEGATHVVEKALDQWANPLVRTTSRAMGKMFGFGLGAVKKLPGASVVGKAAEAVRFREAQKFVSAMVSPMSAVPREVVGAFHEAVIARNVLTHKTKKLADTLSKGGVFDAQLGIVVPRPVTKAERLRIFRHMDRARDDALPISALPEDLRGVPDMLRDLLEKNAREAVRLGNMSVEAYRAGRRRGHMPRYYAENELQAGGVLEVTRRWMAGKWRKNKDRTDPQTSSAWFVFERDEQGNMKRDADGVPILHHEPGKFWRFESPHNRDAFYERFIRERTIDELRDRIPLEITGDERAERLALDYDDIGRIELKSAELQGAFFQILGQQRRRYAKGQPLKGEELERMGLVEDVAYSIPKSIASLGHDNIVTRLFNAIELVPGLVLEESSRNKEVPAGYRRIPDSRVYGRLRNKLVQKDVANQILGFANAGDNEFVQVYDEIMRYWKTGKTVYNPGTHVRNVLGNLVFADLAGVSPLTNPHYFRDAARVLIRGADIGGVTREEMIEQGTLGTEFTAQELTSTTQAILTGDLGPNKSFLDLLSEASVAQAGKLAGRTLHSGLMNLYSFEDEIYKAAAYIRQRRLGASKEAAAAHVRKWFPFYDIQGRNTSNRVLRFFFPFWSFTHEWVRIGRNAIREKPFTTMKWVALPGLVSQAVYASMGLDDEEEEHFKSDAKGQLRFTTGVPVTSIPYRGMDGQPRVMDLTAALPWGTALARRYEDRRQRPAVTEVLYAIGTMSPLTGLASGLLQDVDPFTGRQVTKPGQGSVAAGGEKLKYAWNWAVPPVLSWGLDKNPVAKVVAPKPRGPLLERTSLAQRLLNFGGIDVRSGYPDPYATVGRIQKKLGIEVTRWAGGEPDPERRMRLDIRDAILRENQSQFEKLVERYETEFGGRITPRTIDRLLPSHVQALSGTKAQDRQRILAEIRRMPAVAEQWEAGRRAERLIRDQARQMLSAARAGGVGLGGNN